MKSFWLLGACIGFVWGAQAQIKCRPMQFDSFLLNAPLVELPFRLDSTMVLKKTEHEDFTRIERAFAEDFLGIPYLPAFEGEEIPSKVPHYVGYFTAYGRWQVFIYYWFPFPPKRETQDHFDMVVFDAMGGKIAEYPLAGKWGDTLQLATIYRVGEAIRIDLNNIAYEFTKDARLVRVR